MPTLDPNRCCECDYNYTCRACCAAHEATLGAPQGFRTCPTCTHPHTGPRCTNPGCVESGNVPPEIIARRAKEAAEAEERARFANIRNRSYGRN